MMSIPAYYLRKAIYIMLSYAQQSILEVKESIEEAELSLKDFDVEMSWLDQRGYKIDRSYNITKDIGTTWLLIQNHWAAIINKNLASFLPNNSHEYLKSLQAFSSARSEKADMHFKIDVRFRNYCKFVAGSYTKHHRQKKEGANKIDDFKVEPLDAIGFCLICKKATVDSENQLYLNDIIDMCISDKNRSDEESKDFWQTDIETENNHRFSSFFNSNWSCYERTDGIVPVDATWGIARSNIWIGSPAKDRITPIKMISSYASGEHTRDGKITLEVNQKSIHLIAHLTLQNNDHKSPAFFVMRLNHSKPEDNDVIVGFFISYSVYFGRYLTKSVVWVNNHGVPVKPAFMSDKSEPDLEEIPQAIKSFLHNRLRNRLTMPSSDFFNNGSKESAPNLHFLEEWLDRRDKNLINDYILTGCEGDYYVFYNFHPKPNEIKQVEDVTKFLRMDELSIHKNLNSVEFETKYVHKRFTRSADIKNNVSNSSDKILPATYEGATFEGIARRYRSTLQIISNEKQFIDKNGLFEKKIPYGNFVHIMFGVPFVNHVAFNNEFSQQEYFIGVASGLNDSNNDPVSFRILIMRKEKLRKALKIDEGSDFQPVDYKDNPIVRRICKYFFANRKRNSILIETKPSNLADRYPYIDEIRESEGGEVSITGTKNGYAVRIKYQGNENPIFDGVNADLEVLLASAEERAKDWLLNSRTNK